MIHGLDTGFLVAVEVREHAEHAAARATLAQVLSAGDVIAIAPQVLAEFIHVVTDARRFTQPLDMNAARHVAEQWWTSSDVVHAFPDAGVVQQFFTWLQQFSLGRKRLLDTLLAATYRQAGIQSLLTTNQSDFLIFGVFTCVAPGVSGTNP
jgi:predicted nucleic acid-binding protein